MRRVAVLLALTATLVAAKQDDGGDPKAMLNLLEQKIHQGVNNAIDAAQAWNKTVLVDAALRKSVSPCKTGYLADAAGKCTVCDYTLSMVPGCNACTEPGTCSGCSEGYTYVAAANSPNSLDTGTCICDAAHLNDPNCAQCGVAGSCDQCYNGYFPNPATKVCTQCSSNCRVCDSATACNVCQEGYSLDPQGQCVACKAGCLECADGANGPDTCYRCKQDLYPDGSGGCVPAAAPNCLQVSESSATTCAVCEQGYSLVAGSCIACKTGCLVCADGAGGVDNCLRCKENLYLNASDPGACAPPAVPNCLQVGPTATECAVCAEGYSLTDTAQCVPCKPGCLECADGANGPDTCLRCKQDLYPDGSGACIPAAAPNCLQVSESDANFCAVCEQGYSLVAGSCVACKTGCLVCADGAGGVDNCLRCQENLYLNATDPGACAPPAVPNCLQVSPTASECAVCAEGYSLTDTAQCVPCKLGCLECADGPGGPDTCLRCKQDLYPDGTGGCVPASALNCLQVSESSANVCAVCEQGYSLVNGTCVACKAGCLVCADGAGGINTCLRCQENLYLNATDPGACAVPTAANCLQPGTSAAVCAVCEQGYSLTVSNTCVPCKVGCLVCADGVNGTATCLRCEQDLYPDPTDVGACIPALVPNCLQVSEASALTCAVCDLGFSLLNGQCVPCKAGCLECTGSDSAGVDVCQRCKQGLYPNVTDPGACIPPAVPNCLQVSDLSATTCAVCNQSYSLQPDGSCLACNAGCLVCADGAGGPATCLRCIQGLFPNTSAGAEGTCVPAAVANCATVSDTSAAICEVCDPKFALSTNATECLPCGSGCAQCHVGAAPIPNDAKAAKPTAAKAAETTVCDVCINTNTNSTISTCPDGSCANLQTDVNNCGACGNACPSGAICSAGACICADNGQPVVPAVPATCGQLKSGSQAVSTYQYTVIPGATYAARYDSFQIPDRYVLRIDSPCGPIVYDTSFTGQWASGCKASAPCCDASLGGGCLGIAANGTFCPPNSGGGGPPGGPGAGLVPDQVIPATTTTLFATAYGVCTNTANQFTLTGAGGAGCP